MRSLQDWLSYVEKQEKSLNSKDGAPAKAPEAKPEEKPETKQAEPVKAETAAEAPKAAAPEAPAAVVSPAPEKSDTKTAPGARVDPTPAESKPVMPPAPKVITDTPPVTERSIPGTTRVAPPVTHKPAAPEVKPSPRPPVPSVKAPERPAARIVEPSSPAPRVSEIITSDPDDDSRQVTLPFLPHETPPSARKARSRVVQVHPPDNEEIREMWNRLPHHVQLLMSVPESEEIAQKSYKVPFRETREDLIRRLLDPPMSLEDTARVLGVCPTTVRRYTNKDLLPHYRTAGNQRRFRLSDVLAFLETHGKIRDK